MPEKINPGPRRPQRDTVLRDRSQRVPRRYGGTYTNTNAAEFGASAKAQKGAGDNMPTVPADPSTQRNGGTQQYVRRQRSYYKS